MKNLLKGLMGLTALLFLFACTDTQNSSGDQSQAREVADKITAERSKLRKSRVSNISYTLAIDLVSDPDVYSGEAKISFALKNHKSNLTIDFTGGAVQAVELNDANITVDYSGYFITLPSESLLEGENKVVITYSHPYDQDGTGLHRFTDPEDGETYLYSYLWPYYANRLFPNFDQPNLKATYEMTVRAKRDWQVVSSLMEDTVTTDGDHKIWHFPRSKTFSSYIFSLHAGPYTVWKSSAGDIPIRLMARQSLAEYVDVDEWFQVTKFGLDHYKKYFDISYPFTKYDQVIVPDFNIGAMENVGAVTFAERYVQRGPSSRFQRQRAAETILHEMAHMWFGDLVTKSWWNGLWLNESFATLMSSIAVSKLPEYKDLWHDFYLSTNLGAIGADKMVSSHPIEVAVPSTDDFFSVFDSITYEKGASVLNQLSHYVGEENFRIGISNYLKEHAWGNTELKDFIDAQSKQADLDLSPWAQNWLYKQGVNRIKTNFKCEAGKLVHLELTQFASEDHPTLRSQRTQLALFDDSRGSMLPFKVLPITIAGSVSAIAEVEGLTCPTLVFPNYQGWGYTEVELDDVSKKNALRAITLSDDPFLRSMLWTSVLDNTETDFERVIEIIKQEQNDRVIKQVLSELVKKINAFERQGNRMAFLLSQKLEAMLWHQITKSESSKSVRILRLENFIRLVRSENGRRNIVSLLENTTELPSLPISQEHRWLLIKRLAVLSDEQAKSFIRNEKKADKSDAGRRAAIAAEASLADLSIKRKWMTTFLDNKKPMPLSNQRAAMRNIFPANQLLLQEKLLPEMIKALPMIRKTRDNYYQRSYARELFAGICSAKGLSQIESVLDKNKLGTTLYRFLSENVQQAQSCVKELSLQKDVN